MSIDGAVELQSEAIEQRRRAHSFVTHLAVDALDKPQRVLRRKILHQLQGGHYRPDLPYLYDSTRRALWLVEQLERGDLSASQRAVLSSVNAALHAAEDAAGAATHLRYGEWT